MKRRGMRRPRKPIDTALVKYALKVGQVGFCLADVEGFTAKVVDEAQRRLVKAGELHKGKIGHRTMKLFATAEWAEAYVACYVTASAVHKDRTIAQAVITRAPWAPGTEAQYPTDPAGNPLYKVTVYPTPAPALRTNTHADLL